MSGSWESYWSLESLQLIAVLHLPDKLVNTHVVLLLTLFESLIAHAGGVVAIYADKTL